MELQVTGKNLDVGDALRTYVTQRIEQAVDKYIGRSLPGHIRIEKERGNFRTDCSIQLKSGLSLQSRGEAPDAYASADLALERLEKRLRRYKRRLKNHHGPAQDVETAAPYYVIQAAEDEEETVEDDNPVIIAETETMIQVLPVSDAVMRMDVSDRPVLVFRNASHGRINVVYRREDGNIGWIDPGDNSENAG